MRTVSPLIAVLALASCASAPNETMTTQDRVVLSGSQGTIVDVDLRRDDYSPESLVAASRETLWDLLPEVYTDLGLPAPAADPSIWTVAVQDHVTMRRVGDQRMSRLLDCGNDITGPLADRNRIRLNVRTWLEEAGESTLVRSRLEATSTSVEGRAGTTTCVSRGVLEARITQALRARISS
ncbi:MAG TPA: hypothetical protein VFZ24_07475 [Longimicrobiales bacterium]